MAMRLTKVDPATAQPYVTKVQGLTMTSNDDNAIVPHGTNDPLTINRIYRGIGEDGDIQLSGQISKTFIDFLKDNNDPRLPILSYVYPPPFHRVMTHQEDRLILRIRTACPMAMMTGIRLTAL